MPRDPEQHPLSAREIAIDACVPPPRERSSLPFPGGDETAAYKLPAMLGLLADGVKLVGATTTDGTEAIWGLYGDPERTRGRKYHRSFLSTCDSRRTIAGRSTYAQRTIANAATARPGRFTAIGIKSSNRVIATKCERET